MLGVDASREALLELFGKRTTFIVACAVVSSDNNLANVAKVNLGDSFECGLGIVAPFSAAEAGKEMLTNRFEHLRWDFWLTGLGRFNVLGLDQGTKPWDAVTEDNTSERALHLGKPVQYGVTMYSACAQPLWLRARWPTIASWATLVAASLVTATAASTAFAVSTSTVAIAASTAFAIAATSVAIAASTATTVSVAASTAAVSIPTTTFTNELGGDTAAVVAGTKDFERLLLLPLLLGRHDCRDEHTIDGKVGVDTHNIAHGRSLVEEASVEDALGLFGPGLSPGVGTIITFTG